MYFDSHCHLDFPSLKDHLEEQLRAAVSEGIESVFVPGCRESQWRELADFGPGGQEARDDIWLGVGQHPYWAKEVRELPAFGQRAAETISALKAVAVGECGLDKKRGGAMEHQLRLLELHLDLAKQHKLPVVLHCVAARQELLACLDRVGLGEAGGVVHGFSGDLNYAQALNRRGLLLGLGPAVTRKSKLRLRAAISAIPQEFLVLETDAPDQSVRGGKVPGGLLDLVVVAQEVAQLRKQPIEVIAEQTTDNARRLFQLNY